MVIRRAAGRRGRPHR